MIKTILFIILVIVCLIGYTLWVKEVPKKEENQTFKEVKTSQKIEILPEPQMQTGQELQKTAPSNSKPSSKVKTIPEPTTEIPAVELKYYNLSIEKDYNDYYNNDKKIILEQNMPPLSKEEVEEKSDLNINLTPEINYNKETKEITIDGVQIQLEKKF